jgi:hypothetical protein
MLCQGHASGQGILYTAVIISDINPFLFFEMGAGSIVNVLCIRMIN